MAKGKVVAAATHAERKRLRSTIGALKDLRVGVGVQKRYKRAVNFFLWFCWAQFGQMADDYDQLDKFAVAFIHAAWNEGEPRSLIADCLSGIMYAVDRKRILPSAWSWLTTWEQHEMPTKAHPLTCPMVFALAGLCWKHELLELCCLIPVAFCTMLRTAEILGLRRDHVSFSLGKASLQLCGKTGSRTGAAESAVVDDAVAVRLLRLLCDNKTGPEKLLSMTEYAFRKKWKWLVQQLLLCPKNYAPYGIRRGGACEDFAVFGDGARLCLKGRWGSIRTARGYAEEALRIRQSASVSAAADKAIEFWSHDFGRRFQQL